jgi:PAS domain S-box-containing protein
MTHGKYIKLRYNINIKKNNLLLWYEILMITNPEKTLNTNGDDLALSSPIISDNLLDTFQASIRRFEGILFFLLIIHGLLVLINTDNPPALLAIVALLSLNILSVIIDRQGNQNFRLLRALFTISIAGVLTAFAMDPANMLVAWFYFTLVYYSFTLRKSHQYIVMATIPLIYFVATIIMPRDIILIEFITHFGLIVVIGGLMRYVTQLIDHAMKHRNLLMDNLLQMRDTYARQLEERTSELQGEIQEREQAQTQLVEERQLLQTIINTIPNHIFVKDRDSRFTLLNQWTLKMLGVEDKPESAIGKSDIDYYPQFAERTYADEQQIMETGEPIIDREETIQDDQGIDRHYLISKVPMYHPKTQEVIGLVGVTTDVTSLQETQIALRESEESLKVFQLRLKTLNQITTNLTRIGSFDELVYQSMKQAIDHLGFTQISCRFIDPENPTQLIGGCQVDQNRKIVMTKYETITVPEDHPVVQIIKGNKTNHIVRDTAIYDAEWNFIGQGDKAFSALLDGDKIIGFLYTDTLFDNAPISESQFELLNLYGATLGALFNRQKTQEALKISEEEALHFQQQLKQLNEITIELESVDTLTELCRQAVVLGREKLGFERIGIWLSLDDNPDMRQGMWGTDKDGNLIDERHLLVPVPEHEAKLTSEGDIFALNNDDLRHYNHEINSTGDGWLLIGLMWDGTKRVGWVFADNVVYGKPLTKNVSELFRLYAATIGLLCVRQIADEKLRESEIRYRAITETSSDIIMIVDKEANVTYISPSLKVVMGIEPTRIIGQSVMQIIHRDDIPEATHLLQQCLQFPHLNTRMNEFRARHAYGHWVQMEAVITSMIDDPVINGILISCRDLTHRLIADERKRIMERERERASVLRQFINDISHDFRTPLSTISTNAYLLKLGKQEHITKRVDMIDQQIERLAKLIDNMNTITKLDETSHIRMEQVNINRILESISYDKSQDIQDKQLNLTLELQTPLPAVIGNVSLLNDAFYHLIDNAIQFCNPEDSIMIQSSEDQESVIIQITDTGDGIAQEDIPFIFDRLYRADKARSTDTGGSGLGLAITRRIIDLHQGHIEVSSQLDEGTTIHLRLPIQNPEVKSFV